MKLVRHDHDDIDVGRPEGVLAGPEQHRHTANDHRMDAERRSDSLDYPNDLERPFLDVVKACRVSELRA